MGKYNGNGRQRKDPYLSMTSEDFKFLYPDKKGKPLTK